MVDDGPGTDLPPVHEAWLPREHFLHRPRHGGRQLTALICAVVFFAAPTVMWLGGMRPQEIENHPLAAFPGLADGWAFFTGMDGWATDNLVFRGGALATADWVSRTLFGEPPPFDEGGGAPAGPLPGGPVEDPTGPGAGDSDAGPSESPPQAGFRRVVEGTDGWLYFGTDALAKCHPEHPLDETMAALTALRKAVEDSGREFVLVVVPDKSTAVPEHLPDSYPGKECAEKVTPDLWQQAVRVAGAMDIRTQLDSAARRLDRPVYYPMDTHWTHEGSIEMVRALAEQVRPNITRPWELVPHNRYSNPADLPPLIGRTGDNHATSYLLEPDGEEDRTEPGTSKLADPVHDATDPIRGMISTPTVVLGDSFLVAASRYLPAAFADLTMQYYNTAASDPATVIDTIGDGETVVLEVVERNIAAGNPPVLDRGFIDKLRTELARRPVR